MLTVWYTDLLENPSLAHEGALDTTIKQAIENVRAFMVVFSSNTFNSQWVFKEVCYALEVRTNPKQTPQIFPPSFLIQFYHG